MALSTISPTTVELIKINNNIAYYKLRKNIKTITSHNDLLNSDESLYQFDELNLSLSFTDNSQLDEVKNNFDIYWTLANNQTIEKQELESKRQQVINLIDNNNYGLIKEGQDMKNQILTAMDGIATLYEQIISTK
jgi:hypothetical protein